MGCQGCEWRYSVEGRGGRGAGGGPLGPKGGKSGRSEVRNLRITEAIVYRVRDTMVGGVPLPHGGGESGCVGLYESCQP